LSKKKSSNYKHLRKKPKKPQKFKRLKNQQKLKDRDNGSPLAQKSYPILHLLLKSQPLKISTPQKPSQRNEKPTLA
jgi:hypothetical protein